LKLELLFAAVELELFFVDSGVGSDMFGESKSEMDNSEGLDIVIRFGVCVNEVDRAPQEAFGSVWGRSGIWQRQHGYCPFRSYEWFVVAAHFEIVRETEWLFINFMLYCVKVATLYLEFTDFTTYFELTFNSPKVRTSDLWGADFACKNETLQL
jgi:hypothetical protein